MAGAAVALLAVILAAMALLATILRGYFEELIQSEGFAYYYTPFATVAIIAAIAAAGSFAAAMESMSDDMDLDAALLGLSTGFLIWAIAASVNLIMTWVNFAQLEASARRREAEQVLMRSIEEVPLGEMRELQGQRQRILQPLTSTRPDLDTIATIAGTLLARSGGERQRVEALVRDHAEEVLDQGPPIVQRLLDPNSPLAAAQVLGSGVGALLTPEGKDQESSRVSLKGLGERVESLQSLHAELTSEIQSKPSLQSLLDELSVLYDLADRLR